jgi:hypothetical protein
MAKWLSPFSMPGKAVYSDSAVRIDDTLGLKKFYCKSRINRKVGEYGNHTQWGL